MKLYPDVFNEFVETSGRIRTKKSRESFVQVIRMLQGLHPDKHIGQFTTDDLTAFCIGHGLAPATIAHRRDVIRGVFGWAEWKGYTKTNPSSALKYTVVPGKHTVRPGNWYDEQQAGILLRSCSDDFKGRRNKLILLFGLLMGLRLADIAAVRWSKFTPDLRQLTLLRKGNKMTTLGVPKQLADELAAWRQEAPVGTDIVLPRLRNLTFASHEQYIDWDTPIGESGIAELIKGAGERCEMKLAPHDLRRSFAGILEEKGIPVTDIQRAMGHENVGTTSRYLDKNPRKTVAVTEGLTIDY